MAALQSIIPVMPSKAGPAVGIAANSPAGGGKQGLFGSIFSKAVEAGDQPQEAGICETASGKNATGKATSSNARLGALLQQIASLLGRETGDKSFSLVTNAHGMSKAVQIGKNESGKLTDSEGSMGDANDKVGVPMENDPASLVSAIEQMLGGWLNSLQPQASVGKGDQETDPDEKILENIDAALDKLKSLTCNGVDIPAGSVTTENGAENGANSGDRSPQVLGNAEAVKDTLSKIAASLRQIVEQMEEAKEADAGQSDNSGVKRQIAELTGPGSGGDVTPTMDMKAFHIKSTDGIKLSRAGKGDFSQAEAKASDTSAKNPPTAEMKAVPGNAANEADASLQFAAIRKESAENVEGAVFAAVEKGQQSDSRTGKSGQQENGGNSAVVEVTVKNASIGHTSGETGDMSGKDRESGKGNFGLPDLTAGMRPQGFDNGSFTAADGLRDDPAKNVTPDQIMKQVSEKLAEAPLKGDAGVVTLKLHPEELGELKVQVKLEDQKLKVEVIAENRVVKDVLVQNMGSLKETLSRHNMTMERFDVFTAGNGGASQQFNEGRNSSRNPRANRYDRYTLPLEGERMVTARYLDQMDNSLVDVRF